MLLPMQLIYSILLGSVVCPFLKMWPSWVYVHACSCFPPRGAVHMMVSSNDSSVRDYDMETFQLCKHVQFNWPVNVSPIWLLSCVWKLEYTVCISDAFFFLLSVTYGYHLVHCFSWYASLLSFFSVILGLFFISCWEI
jgi:hypothetical protein